VVGLTFCQLVEKTEYLFLSIQGEQKEKRSWREGNGVLGIFDPAVIFDRDHQMWTLRNGMSIIIAFYVGWHGYQRYISMYNASLASTVAVLLSKFVGSAMTKNLARLQGVVLGIVLGNILYALLGWCYWWGHLLVAVALYSWTLLGLFMYYHSENYSTVGVLLVVFGSQSLLRPCANTETDPSGLSLIVNATLGITIMTLVDLLLSRARASELALNGFKDAAAPLWGSLGALFDAKETTVPNRTGGLAGPISNAKSLGFEAAQEPRFWRLAWPTDNFDQGISCITSIRFSLLAIEAVVLSKPDAENNRTKTEVFQNAIAMESFSGPGGVHDVLKDHYGSVMELFEASLGDIASQDVFLERLNSLNKMKARESAHSWGAVLTKWHDALNKEYQRTHSHLILRRSREAKQDLDNLGEDALAELSVVVEGLKAIFTQLDKVLDVVVA
jgi:hypothetical protein